MCDEQEVKGEGTAAVAVGDWQAFRRQMPVTANYVFLDHAAVSPLPALARRAIERWAAEAAEQGSAAWPAWNRRVEATRATAAAMLGASTDEIALVRSTTEGINLVAEGFPWRSGDNVVTLEGEFPSNLYPWMNQARRGVEVRVVPVDEGRVDLARVAEACNERTRIVSVSWVGYALGWRNDLDALAEIAHRCGALLFVDAIQGLGVYPLDVRQTPIDFLAADGHKWLLAPEGAGVFYIRRENLDRLNAIGVGWNSVVHPYQFHEVDFTLKPTAARYEGGAPNTVGWIALGESMRLLHGLGTRSVCQRVLELTDEACERLQAIGARIASPRDEVRHKSGIVAFELPGQDSMALREHCVAQRLMLGCRSGRLRISVHAYNNTHDLERLTTILSGR